jgi:hypothetical protein
MLSNNILERMPQVQVQQPRAALIPTPQTEGHQVPGPIFTGAGDGGGETLKVGEF